MVIYTRKNPRRDQEFEESRLRSESETSMPQNVPTSQQKQNGPGRATAVVHDQVLVEDITEVTGGPVLRPNLPTSLKLQQLMRVMETMAQTMATQNAQINERFDRWLGQQNGQNGNQGVPNGVPAARPQVEAQPNAFGVNPPHPDPLSGQQSICSGQPIPSFSVI
ncbi:unnamed protein product [Prunus armeniaca]